MVCWPHAAIWFHNATCDCRKTWRPVEKSARLVPLQDPSAGLLVMAEDENSDVFLDLTMLLDVLVVAVARNANYQLTLVCHLLLFLETRILHLLFMTWSYPDLNIVLCGADPDNGMETLTGVKWL